jgi:hypothetical protein
MREQATTILTNAVYPTYNYDLDGIIREDGTATCPECGSVTTEERASQTVSRWKAVKRALIMLLAAPLAICLYSYVINLSWEYGSDALFEIGFIPLVLTFYYILITAIVLLILEWRTKRKNKHCRVTPSVWLCVAAIIIPAAISITAIIFVLVPWADAIASV